MDYKQEIQKILERLNIESLEEGLFIEQRFIVVNPSTIEMYKKLLEDAKKEPPND